MAGKVLTEKFKSQNAIDFYNNLDTDNDYIMASCATAVPSDIVNSVAAKNEFMRRVIFGNKITTADARFLFRKIEWVSGKVYAQYDDIVDLTDRDYYVSILVGQVDEANYRIYKCINNNANSASVVSPSTVSFDPTDDGYFGTGDGYIWKYMFDVTPAEYTKYQTQAELPYKTPVNPTTGNDGIYNIIIEETSEIALTLFSEHNVGTCQILSTVQEASGLWASRVQASTTVLVKSEENSYAGMYLEVQGTVYNIIGSSKPANITGNVFIVRTIEKPPEEICYVKPKILVTNSNSGGTTCLASGILDEFGRLVRVHFNRHGSGYNYAKAKLILPPSLKDFDGIVNLRPIVSPSGGHGVDPIIELKMSKVGIVTNIVSLPTTETPDSNTYTQVGLVRNPGFTEPLLNPLTFDNRKTFIVVGDVTNTVEPNKYIEQTTSDETATAYIHDVEYDSDLNITIVKVVDFVGAAQTQISVGVAFVKSSLDSSDSISFEINTIEQGSYQNMSGDLLHFVNFDPITRTPDNVEKIKLIFDF